MLCRTLEHGHGGNGHGRDFLTLCFARMFASANEGSTGSGGTAWLSQHYPAAKRSRVLGLFQMGAPLGMALGTLLGGAVLSLTGNWRYCFLIFIVPALLLAFLIFCAVAAILCRRLVSSVIIFMAYSAVMSLLWFLLESPDLAVTEAAVGAGVTTLLFFLTLRKINGLKGMERDED